MNAEEQSKGLAECYCDPPGSGEEYCTGHCFLMERIKTLESGLREAIEIIGHPDDPVIQALSAMVGEEEHD